MKDNGFTYPLKWQILLGFIFAALEFGANYLQRFNPIPLYMDTTFTIASSFFGGVSGLITAVVYQVAANLIYSKSLMGSCMGNMQSYDCAHNQSVYKNPKKD